MRKITINVISMLLISNAQFVDAQVKDQPIEIRSFSINIRTGVFTATTVLDIEFYNPNNKVLDGEYNFSLNAGQVITGFSLDINGNLREGVIVDKQQGRVAYENTIRRRIDPGLLEMTANDNYKVRVYPMPAMGTRKIQIIISEQLAIKNNALQYFLPLDIAYPIRQFSLSAESDNSQPAPVVNDGLLRDKSFFLANNKYQLSFNEKDIQLKKPVSFSISLPVGKTACFVNDLQGKYFAIREKADLQKIPAPQITSAVIFWDVSGSASKRNIKKEIEFLDSYCSDRNIERLTVVTFSNTLHETRKYSVSKGINSGVKNFLQSQVFDGGTRLGAIDCSNYPADIVLVFSDGLNNFGNAMIKTGTAAVNCINSSPVANHSLLKKISEGSGGRYINLISPDLKDAIVEISHPENQLLSVKSEIGSVPVNALLPYSFDNWITITGKINSDRQQLAFGYGNMGKLIKTQTIIGEPDNLCDSAEVRLLVMLQQFAMLQKFGNDIRILDFAKRNKLVTLFTSFIVLDNLSDYIQHGIEPPQELQEEYMKRMGEITQQRKQQQTHEANALINNLRISVTQYNERISWWNKTEPLISFDELVKKNKEINVLASRRAAEVETNNRNNNDEGFDNIKMSAGGSLSEVVVTASGLTRQRRSLTGSVSVIGSSELSATGNISQALAGRVAGLQVIDRSAPGAISQIFIRGAMSSSTGGQPLFIIDGVPVEAEFATTMAANEVESITVLKGVQASIVYGSRASNGAIVITRKKNFGNSNRSKDVPLKYKYMEDADYVTELKEASREEMYDRYLKMKDTLGEEPSFYFDAAELMFRAGDKETAMRILSNLLEIDNENHQLLRAVGYMLETWNLYEAAAEIYQQVLTIKEEEPQSYRDLALAYEKYGKYQLAVDVLYASLTKNWNYYDGRYNGLRSIILTEMNTIISKHRDSLDLSMINDAIIKPLPVDLRIVVDWNKDETDIDLHVVEPGGEECFYSHRQSKNGGRMAEDFTQGYGPEEYQIKNAVKGKYSIQVNYYGDRYQKKQIPSFIKLTIYKNYGRVNQTVTTETLIMDNQTGKVEIGEVKW